MFMYRCSYCLLSFRIPKELENHVNSNHLSINPKFFYKIESSQKTVVIASNEDVISKKEQEKETIGKIDVGNAGSNQEIDRIDDRIDEKEDFNKTKNFRNRMFCNICHKPFCNQKHLATHMLLMHSRNNKFYCKFCNEAFSAKINLRLHEKSHPKKSETP